MAAFEVLPSVVVDPEVVVPVEVPELPSVVEVVVPEFVEVPVDSEGIVVLVEVPVFVIKSVLP